MKKNKVKSFTLSELIVVMILTAIVVGMAFMVLRMVQKQSGSIQKNLDKNAGLANFEQQLLIDMNRHGQAFFEADRQTLTLISAMDTVVYRFQPEFILRDKDSIHLKIHVKQAFYEGQALDRGRIDALDISAENEITGHTIFVSRSNDAALKMNEDGI